MAMRAVDAAEVALEAFARGGGVVPVSPELSAPEAEELAVAAAAMILKAELVVVVPMVLLALVLLAAGEPDVVLVLVPLLSAGEPKAAVVLVLSASARQVKQRPARSSQVVRKAMAQVLALIELKRAARTATVQQGKFEERMGIARHRRQAQPAARDGAH